MWKRKAPADSVQTCLLRGPPFSLLVKKYAPAQTTLCLEYDNRNHWSSTTR